MPKNESSLTVFFDPPFWVGLYRRQEGDRLSVCKIIFGAEPRDSEVYEFLLAHWGELHFSPAVTADDLPSWPVNPKRRQREIRRELKCVASAGTKAQQALQAQREALKEEKRHRRQERKEFEAERKFSLRQERRKEKHKGH